VSSATRPTVAGYGGAVSAGHHLATQIGAQMLADGGNAADAACAMGFALQVLEPTQNGPAGEAPILYYCAGEDRTYAISGQGTAPATASLDAMRKLGIDVIPADGYLPATVPAALDAWCQLLERFGTKQLGDVTAPARGLAQRGFPMYRFLKVILDAIAVRFRDEWPTSAAVYTPVRKLGEAQTNPALAAFFADLAAAERDAGGSRESGIRAARDFFYRGRPAEQIERFAATPIRDASGRSHPALLTAHDLASYRGSIEEPTSAEYRGARFWKLPPWSQGPVLLQQLRLLEGFDLSAMGRGSADALHTWIEVAKLAFADRETCYADPRFAKVPLAELLSPAYTDARRALVDPARASLELRPGVGRVPDGWAKSMGADGTWGDGDDPPDPTEPQALAAAVGRGDTTHLDACDRFGNLVSATPSGGWIPTSPVIPELGFPLGTRGQMFCLDPEHPNALAPAKRPRTTLSPGLAQLPDGRRLAFGTPGGDQQDQWPVPLLLDLVDFGVHDLQESIDAPTLHIEHMPSSFFPHFAQPGVVMAESRVDPQVLSELTSRGHRMKKSGAWHHGRVLAVTHDSESGLCEAAASSRFRVASSTALP